jgi:hypothetical protein
METIRNEQEVYSNEYGQAYEIDQQVIAELNNDDMCNVYRTELEKDQKNRSYGLLVSFLSCNVVIGFSESIKSEGCRRVTVKVNAISYFDRIVSS